MRRSSIPWPYIVVAACALVVLAVDSNAVGGLPANLWTLLYLIVAGLLVAWRATGRPPTLLAAGALLASLSWVRITVFLVDGHRWAGIAVNVLVIELTLAFVASRRHRSDP